MSVTIENVAEYSMNKGKEIAFEITYSEGTKVRSVIGSGMIRKEYKKDGVWLASGKPYIVDHNKKRQAEEIMETVKEMLK